VAVKIRLKRMGKIRQPYYRLVVVDSRKKRDGKVIEEIGKYHPKLEPSFIEVVSDRAQYWLGVGAQPTEAVEAILKVTGDWQKFKGLPGAEGTLRTAEPRRDKTEIFNEALKDAANEPKSEAVTRKRAAKKAAQPAAEETPAAEEIAPAPAAEAPAADAAPAAETPAEDPAPEAEELAPAPATPEAEETPVAGGDESSVSSEAAAEADIAEEAPDADAEAAADANADSGADAGTKA
jgi:small subunit ribosomal protein S16